MDLERLEASFLLQLLKVWKVLLASENPKLSPVPGEAGKRDSLVTERCKRWKKNKPKNCFPNA